MAKAVPNTISRTILHEMLSLPTAPFAEHYVLEYVRNFCKRRKILSLKVDQAGNLLLRLRQCARKVQRPVCITAHLDHPGFVAEKMITKRNVRAFWRGGVAPEYFVDSRVRFFVDGKWIKGCIARTKTVMLLGRRRVDTAVIDVSAKVPPGSIGMWDFPDPRVRGTRIYARACDDIAGAAAILACIDRLIRSKRSCDAYFLLTRAEEVGFIGAIAAAKSRTIPKKCYVVAMETSSELPFAKMGDGPILRVGDRASAFTPAATAYCHRIARELQREDSRFCYQRKLMDGGTCESSAYCSLGYDATGICIALGNYHNVNSARGTLGPEYVDLNDYDRVVRWFVELAAAPFPYTGRDETLDVQLKELERTYGKLLRTSVKKPR